MIDRFVKRGIDLGWEAYELMADGEEVFVGGDLPKHTVSRPDYNGVPDACSIYGLYIPEMTEKPFGVLEFHNYMELPGGNLTDPDEDTLNIIARNEKGYVWFAENGHRVLSELAKRRNETVVCVRVPNSIKVNLEHAAKDEGVAVSDVIRKQIENYLVSQKREST